jgi:short-subunit dehydrogenase
MRFENKVVLITGASSGIGRALALALAEKQCRLLLVARREALLQELISALPSHPLGHLAFACDVADSLAVEKACSDILQAGIVPDVLILNAGVSSDKKTGFSAEDIDLEDFRRQMEVNLFGALYFIKHLLPAMLARGSGLVAANGSLAAYRGMPRSAPYSASKAALARLIESLRIDLWGRGVKFILISPGFVETAMTGKLDFHRPFMMSAEKAARIIISGLEREKPEIHFPYRLSLAAKLAGIIPDNLYARLIHNARVKAEKWRSLQGE